MGPLQRTRELRLNQQKIAFNPRTLDRRSPNPLPNNPLHELATFPARPINSLQAFFSL